MLTGSSVSRYSFCFIIMYAFIHVDLFYVITCCVNLPILFYFYFVDVNTGELERTERIFTQMGKANAAAQQSIKFQTRLDEVTSRVNQIRSQLEKLTQRREAPPDYDVTYTALELCSKVQRKWPTKFLFFRSDLGDAYESSVERVCDLAQKFVHWCKAQFKVGKEQFHTDFKTMFPVVWNRFLEDSSETDMM